MNKKDKERNAQLHLEKLRPATAVAEAGFYRCPHGHHLPHHTNFGNCTPLHCAAQAAKEKRKVERALAAAAPAPEEVRALVPEGSPPEMEQQVTERRAAEMVRLGHSAGRFAARRAFLKTPTGLEGGDAEAFADKKLVEMLPYAVAELEYRLKFGDDEQRFSAAQRVLDSTGRGKRESGGASTAPMVMIFNGGASGATAALPWETKALAAKALKPLDRVAAALGPGNEPAK